MIWIAVILITGVAVFVLSDLLVNIWSLVAFWWRER
jgi:hypothetical protein